MKQNWKFQVGQEGPNHKTILGSMAIFWTHTFLQYFWSLRPPGISNPFCGGNMDIFSIFSLSSKTKLCCFCQILCRIWTLLHTEMKFCKLLAGLLAGSQWFFFCVCIFQIVISIIYPFLLKCFTLLNFVYACTYCTKECFPAIELQQKAA